MLIGSLDDAKDIMNAVGRELQRLFMNEISFVHIPLNLVD